MSLWRAMREENNDLRARLGQGDPRLYEILGGPGQAVAVSGMFGAVTSQSYLRAVKKDVVSRGAASAYASGSSGATYGGGGTGGGRLPPKQAK